WRQLPLTGVSSKDLEGYFDWLGRSKPLLQGARLCDEEEWEHAARGADARSFPSGERLSPNEADIDVSYSRQPDSYGPDPVGSYPASASPFGVLDMAGNANEMTRAREPGSETIFLRGGSWYYTDRSAFSANRAPAEPSMRNTVVGVRVCVSYPSSAE